VQRFRDVEVGACRLLRCSDAAARAQHVSNAASCWVCQAVRQAEFAADFWRLVHADAAVDDVAVWSHEFPPLGVSAKLNFHVQLIALHQATLANHLRAPTLPEPMFRPSTRRNIHQYSSGICRVVGRLAFGIEAPSINIARGPQNNRSFGT